MTNGEVQLENIRWGEDGLVPAIVQDAVSKDVLMLAYMNKESLQRSLESGETWFWSRSRGEYWHKGATSGHTQTIRDIRYDCDADTLLVMVEPNGPACHTGEYSCFYRRLSDVDSPGSSKAQNLEQSDGREASADSTKSDRATGAESVRADQEHLSTGRDRFAMLSTLESVIAAREAERPEGAYTTYLFTEGVDKILKKVGEETAEIIIAAKNRDPDELRCEVSDLLFHLMVLLREQKLPLDAVMDELKNRHGG